MQRVNESERLLHGLTERVIGAAIEVHRTLGPGLLESAYERCLQRELYLLGIESRRQVPVPLKYKGVNVGCGYKIDLLIEKRLIIELKCVDKVTDVPRAQVITYLKLSKLEVALLINFNSYRLVDGIHRIVEDVEKEDNNEISF